MKNANEKLKLDAKVINLHYTDICNYRCRFCHSRFGCTPLNFEDWKAIINNIVKDIPVKRFNLAGGEPLAAPFVQQMIDFIHSLNIDCSIISNGSLLTEEFIRANQGKLSMIGISMDAFSHADNVQLGRVDGTGRTLSADRLGSLADVIHQCGIRLKINTVVNAVNWKQNYTSYLLRIRPERWKILRMIHIAGVNDDGKELLISDEQFTAFVERHASVKPVVEDTKDILNAYIVVNPLGQLLDNSVPGYRVSESLKNHSFLEEFQKITFNETAYWKRY